jgi:Leucine Rich repeat
MHERSNNQTIYQHITWNTMHTGRELFAFEHMILFERIKHASVNELIRYANVCKSFKLVINEHTPRKIIIIDNADDYYYLTSYFENAVFSVDGDFSGIMTVDIVRIVKLDLRPQNPLATYPGDVVKLTIKYIWEGLGNALSACFLDKLELNDVWILGTTVASMSAVLDTLLPSITSDLGDNDTITNATISKFTMLTSLNLYNNDTITDVSISCLVNLMPKASGSTHLNLCENCMITDESVSCLTNLRHLDLRNNHMITDESVSRLTNLVSLELSNDTAITDKTLSYIANCRGCELITIRKN